VTSAEITFD